MTIVCQAITLYCLHSLPRPTIPALGRYFFMYLHFTGLVPCHHILCVIGCHLPVGVLLMYPVWWPGTGHSVGHIVLVCQFGTLDPQENKIPCSCFERTPLQWCFWWWYVVHRCRPRLVLPLQFLRSALCCDVRWWW